MFELLANDFPTRVGMARALLSAEVAGERFPHPRGDGPILAAEPSPWATISPPAWGWPDIGHALRGETVDFPTRVGMARRVCARVPDKT